MVDPCVQYGHDWDGDKCIRCGAKRKWYDEYEI